MSVVRGPEVAEWLRAPHADRKVASVMRARFVRAERIIETMGTLAGDEYLKKLPGYKNLFETTVGDRRIFSALDGNRVLMAVVVEKKKRRLTANQLKPIDVRVKKFAASQRRPKS
jgi:hypothetical protein